MTKYNCGCESEGIILVSKHDFEISKIKKWSDSVGVAGTRELCLYCWCEKHNIKLHSSCKMLKGKWVK